MGGASIEFSIVQELIYELTIEQVMTRDVITITPDKTMDDLKELLRAKRISGVPVVEGDELVGVVSIERVIRSLEACETRALVREHMTDEPCVMRADEKDPHHGGEPVRSHGLWTAFQWWIATAS